MMHGAPLAGGQAVAVFLLLGSLLVTLAPVPVQGAAPGAGGWSPWSQMMSACNQTCGGGTQKRVRSCTSPVPSDTSIESLQCIKEDGDYGLIEWASVPCNTHGCWVEDWSPWGNCTGVCGDGIIERYATCDGVKCEGNQETIQQKTCNNWNSTICPSPCLEGCFNFDDKQPPEADGEDFGYMVDEEKWPSYGICLSKCAWPTQHGCKKRCPEYGVCRDNSTDTIPATDTKDEIYGKASTYCVCTMGYTLSKDGKTCIRPPPTTPTPRPIPTLPAEQKTVATVISKTASTVLIIFVTITLILFLMLRIFSPDRVIQMNMEIALLSAHLFLMFPASTAEDVMLCRFVSIFIHLCFTACYVFIFLEALHMYSLVAYVVKKDGIFSRLQNTLVGWGLSAFIVLFCMCFEYDNYGGKYHCWLQMDTPLVYGQFVPVIALTIITFTLIEAAGAAEYKPLKGMNQKQLLSAKISQRTNLIILPLIFAHWMVGMMAEYEQNMPLYGTFTVLSSVVGVVVFFFHCTNNEEVRAKLKGCYKSMCKSGGGKL